MERSNATEQIRRAVDMPPETSVGLRPIHLVYFDPPTEGGMVRARRVTDSYPVLEVSADFAEQRGIGQDSRYGAFVEYRAGEKAGLEVVRIGRDDMFELAKYGL